MTDALTTPLPKRAPYQRKPMLRRILLNVYIALVGAYGLNTTAYLLLRAAIGERWNAIGLFNSYFHLLLLPAVILLPLSLILRRRWLVLELAAPFLFFVSTYGAQFLPRSVNVPADAPQLSVLSFNALGHNYEVDEVIKTIREANPDIVALQELTYWMAEGMETQLKGEYPYQALHPQNEFTGQGILSRYPITSEEYWQINLGHQQAEIDWNGQPLAFFNVHPAHPLRGFHFAGEERTEEITEILRRATVSTNPVLIAGDFNMTNLSDDYHRVTDLFNDSYTEVGWGMGFTFPNFRVMGGRTRFFPPLARIDYIFHDKHFQPTEARVVTNAAGSDHFPNFATFAFMGSS
ncbi:MAG: endonuclease/exonuclease/phosphatase family protein [Chloroflexi bacterium]|nr:endonuclease/exonuclease/phosphatase family protein [Chloroflexota bacterium]MCC6892516.1 endonuclease/exonuclease/phosphatase family protein [Anaerolineae bacterium]